MLHIMVIAILSGMAGLVLYELVEEIRGGASRLQDRYHE